MEKAFFIQLVSYSPILKSLNIAFREDEKCLTVGKTEAKSGFVLFISCRTIDTPDMLKKVLPCLKVSKTCFRLIKNQNLQYRLNSGSFGDDESGKVISIFPNSQYDLSEFILQIAQLTIGFKGPVIGNAQQLSCVLYIQKAMSDKGDIKLSMPTVKELPVYVAPEYRKQQRKNAIIGSYFLPVQVLRASVKGNIYKGINLRGFAFNWCLIKQGNPVAFDDHFERDMKDRLLWQKEIIIQLQQEVSTPTFIDYFEKRGSSYLVLGFAEGESLGHHVRALLNGTEWKKLETGKKEKILNWYLKAVILIEIIHKKGIIHRDITDSNFIVLQDNTLCIIDFELSYSITQQKPNPPFLLGTFGYASPEQLKYLFPDIKDDIYSLGALLTFMLTGCQPHEFLNATPQIIRTKIQRLTVSDSLTTIAIKCLQNSRKGRPDTQYIKDSIESYLETIKPQKNETVAVAV